MPEIAEYMPHTLFVGLLSGLVSVAFCIQAAKPTARKHGYRVSTRQELVALGAANTFSSFFACFVASSNIGRNTIQDSMGAKSQVASLFGCLLTGLLLAFASQTLYYLPSVSCFFYCTIIIVVVLLTAEFFLKKISE